jgi:hypothetical protein
MQQNRIALLAGVLVVLLGVAWVTGVFDSAPTTIAVPTLAIPGEDVEEISITGPAYDAGLERSGGQWRLVAPLGSPADSASVSRFVEQLTEIEFGSVVSTNPERHGLYGVDSSGSVITVSWGGDSVQLVVAAEGPDFSSNYVRIASSDVVYRTRNRVSVPADLDQLRDKRLLNLAPARVVGASVRTPDEAYELAYGNGGWTITEASEAPAPADSMTVATWLRRFAPLRLDGFIGELSAESMDPSHEVVFRLQDGTDAAVRMVEHSEGYAAWADGNPFVMRANSYRIASLFQASDALRVSD